MYTLKKVQNRVISPLKGVKIRAKNACFDVFPIFYAHGDASEFQYYDLIWKELCGIITNLKAENGVMYLLI